MSGETQSSTRGAAGRRSGSSSATRWNKTVVVAVERRVSHPRYSRVVEEDCRNSTRTDEANACKVGDVVTLVETRPLSA